MPHNAFRNVGTIKTKTTEAQTEHQNEGEEWVKARWAGLSISETAGILHTMVCKEKKKKKI